MRSYLISEATLLKGILVIAACLRLVSLADSNYGFTSDQASFAYNAYSLLKTGKDIYGASLPIYTRGAEAWAPSLPCMLLVPFIKIFGLNEFATLLPSALFGILTVLLTYLAVKRRFHSSTALWAAFLLAISPWHVHLSRSGTEIPLLPCFFMLGLYLFYLGIEGRERYLYLSAVGFAAAFYTYYASRIFIPLAGLGILLIYREELSCHRKAAGGSIALFLLFLLPSILFALHEPQYFFLRYHQIGVTAGGRSLGTGILLFIRNYLAHFSPVFLFFRGDANMRNFPQGFGQLYLCELPLIVTGIIAVIRKRENPDARFLIFWLLTYSIAASLTVENIPHGTRTVTALPLYQILGAVGIYCIGEKLRQVSRWKRTLARAVTFLFVALFGVNALVFYRHYFISWPIYSARAADYGWRDAMSYARSVQNRYDRIVLTVLSVGPPTLFPPFYLKYDPAIYQRSQLAESKYQFVIPEKIPLLFNKLPGNTLYIVREEELRGVATDKIIYFPDGTIAFKIISKRN